jgi:hypothetical protein
VAAVTKPKDIAALIPGDTVQASISARGSDMTEALGRVLASPALTNWERSITPQLSDGLEFVGEDTFAAKPQGEFSVTRTLTVRNKA